VAEAGSRVGPPGLSGGRGFDFVGGALHPYIAAGADSQKGSEEVLHRRALPRPWDQGGGSGTDSAMVYGWRENRGRIP